MTAEQRDRQLREAQEAQAEYVRCKTGAQKLKLGMDLQEVVNILGIQAKPFPGMFDEIAKNGGKLQFNTRCGLFEYNSGKLTAWRI